MRSKSFSDAASRHVAKPKPSSRVLAAGASAIAMRKRGRGGAKRR